MCFARSGLYFAKEKLEIVNALGFRIHFARPPIPSRAVRGEERIPFELIQEYTAMININDFRKCDIRIGKVLSAERVFGSEKLVKIIFDLGMEQRQIIAGIALSYPDLSILVGKLIPIVANLEPRKLMGLESQGMVLAADNEGKPVILTPLSEVSPGSIVK